MLYPLKFKPILKELIWGGDKICRFKDLSPIKDGIGESWEISDVKNNVSVVAEGALAGKNLDELIAEYGEKLLGKHVIERFGTTFPLLIKFIDAQTPLSVQVHPDDALAKLRHNSFGKTEMWYVVKAAPDAYLYSGFSRQITPEEYVNSLENDSFINYLQKHEVKEGDVFFLPAGRVHAIGSGCFIAEIQQTSDITYRIYDYNRRDANGNPRELHTDLAKDAIDYNVYPDYRVSYDQNASFSKLAKCKYFTTELYETEKKNHYIFPNITGMFNIFICLAGQLKITDTNGKSATLKQGETALVAAENRYVDLKLSEATRILRVLIEK